MSNEHTHDPQEPTGARLTDAQVAYMIEHAQYWLRYQQNRRCNPKTDAMSQLSNNVFALLADRAARVAEVARLQAQLDSAHQMLGEVADELTRVEDQTLEMRPLVEAHAKGVTYYKDSTDELICIYCTGRCFADEADEPQHTDYCPITQARALVATMQPPAAPTPLPTRYVRTEDGGIESAPGGLLYTADCNFTEAEWVALLALLNEGYDGLTWEEIEPLVVERIEATTAPTPDGQEGGEA